MSRESLDSFIDKWRARWPEWGIAEAFLARPLRTPVAAWFSLLQELHDAAWAGAEPAPGLAKLAWWQEELRGWSRGARRHPLGEALQRLDADWDALGQALARLPATREPLTPDDGARALQAWAAGVLHCEAALFGGRSPGPEGPGSGLFSDALRIERALARGNLDAALALRATLEAAPGAAMGRPRRLRQAMLRERLRVLAAQRPDALRRPVPPLRMLWASWRAARGGNASLHEGGAEGR